MGSIIVIKFNVRGLLVLIYLSRWKLKWLKSTENAWNSSAINLFLSKWRPHFCYLCIVTESRTIGRIYQAMGVNLVLQNLKELGKKTPCGRYGLNNYCAISLINKLSEFHREKP